MPVRATKRGAARVPFPTRRRCRRPDLRRVVRRSDRRARTSRDGRARARARPLRDRRAPDLGLRRPHGVAAQPRLWKRRSGRRSTRCVVHTPAVGSAPAGRCPFTLLDLRLSAALRRCCSSRPARPSSRRQRSASRTGQTVSTDRGDVTAPLIVDALGWRRVLGPGTTSSRPTGRSRAAWRCTRRASATTSSCGSTRATWTPATAGRSPRATSCASASAPSTRTTRSSSRRCGSWRTSTQQPDGYQGNWIPHRIRPATEDGDLLRRRQRGPLPAAHRRGHPDGALLRHRVGRELRAVLEGRQDNAAALAALPRVQRRATTGSSSRCTSPSSRSGTCTAARWTRSRGSSRAARLALGVPALPGHRPAELRGARPGGGTAAG